jgi:hypothetical protein
LIKRRFAIAFASDLLPQAAKTMRLTIEIRRELLTGDFL